MNPEHPILSRGRSREQEAIRAKELEEALLAFAPEHTYVACGRLLTRLRRMRPLLPISNDASVLIPYWCTIWDEVVSNLYGRMKLKGPKPSIFRIATDYTFGQKEPLKEFMRLLILTQGPLRVGGFRSIGRRDHTVAYMSVSRLSPMPSDLLRKMYTWPRCIGQGSQGTEKTIDASYHSPHNRLSPAISCQQHASDCGATKTKSAH